MEEKKPFVPYTKEQKQEYGNTYNNESCGIQTRLEELFAEYDEILDQRGSARLDMAMQEMFAQFFAAATESTTFDKEIFTRLVKMVKLFSKENIVFVLRDGTEIKGITA